MFKVIARVDDDGEFFRFEYLGEPVRQLRATDSACKCDDFLSDCGQWTMDGMTRSRLCHREIVLLL